MANPVRVLHYGMGHIGAEVARLVHRRPDMVSVAAVDVDPAKIGRKIAGVPVYGPERAADPALPLVLGAVAAAGARPLIRDALLKGGKVEERDFLFVQ